MLKYIKMRVLVAVVVPLLVSISLIGCSTIKTDSDNADGHYVIPETVSIATPVPKILMPYTRRFEDILNYNGFRVGQTSNPNAAQLQLKADDTPLHEKVSLQLVQNGLPILTVESFPRKKRLFGSPNESAAFQNIVQDAANAFDSQLADFAQQIKIVPDNFNTPSFSNVPSNNSPEVIDFGTAFAVYSPSTFVTARHVVKDASNSITLRCPGGQTGNAQVTAVDIYNDLAVLHSSVKAQAFLRLAPDNSVSLGDHIFTVGFPVPGLLGLDPKYSDGVVSSLTGIEDTKNLMQITIPIQPGNSGGAVADAQGQVVGIVVSSAAIPFFIHYTGTLPQNVNWAVRSYYIRPLLSGTKSEPGENLPKLTPIERVTASTCLVEAR